MKTIIDFANKVKTLVNSRMSNIANVEESPSTHPYTVGKQLIFNGLLCKATSAIAVGDTLAVGTNLALSDNVVEQIYSLNQGLTNSLNEIADMNNVLGAKNLLPNEAVSQTINGVTFTVNDDGSVTVNGTATSQANFMLAKTNLEANKYKLSGVPNGSADNTYFMIFYSPSNNMWHDACYDTDADRLIFNPYSDDELSIIIRSGQTVSNITFKPMIRPASVKDTTFVPYSMTNREMTPYVQSISNPNLLDNPWFTVNQRGQASYNTHGSIGYDRWRFYYSGGDGGSVSKSGSVVALQSTGSYVDIVQKPEDTSDLIGKMLTFSMLMSDGTIKSGSALFDGESVTFYNEQGTLSFDYFKPSLSFRIIVYGSRTISFKAVKLEVGSVSTLAQDTAPNYTTELLKCQRYFVRFGLNESVPAYTYNFGMAYEVNSSSAYFNVMIPIPMRSTPLISYQGSWAIGSKALNNITVNSMFNNIVKLVCTTSQTFTAGEIELLENKEAGINYIDFSAEI